jgi:GTP-binding protein
VVLRADRNLATLVDLRMRRDNRAEAGAAGAGGNKTGRSGRDLLIRVPVGTVVRERDADPEEEPFADLTEDGDSCVVARGGRGGRGNARFTTPTRQAPAFAEPGRPGEERVLRLSLKLLADVGLLGFPNAGKSTFIRAVSAATPKVADYPFTTLHPNLGVVSVEIDRSFVIADIPGLIEGAADGAGLGSLFLRHVQRTRLLLHLVDLAPFDDGVDPATQVRAIENELRKYDPAMLEKPRWLVMNKADLLTPEEVQERAEAGKPRGPGVAGAGAGRAPGRNWAPPPRPAASRGRPQSGRGGSSWPPPPAPGRRRRSPPPRHPAPACGAGPRRPARAPRRGPGHRAGDR